MRLEGSLPGACGLEGLRSEHDGGAAAQMGQDLLGQGVRVASSRAARASVKWPKSPTDAKTGRTARLAMGPRAWFLRHIVRFFRTLAADWLTTAFEWCGSGDMPGQKQVFFAVEGLSR